MISIYTSTVVPVHVPKKALGTRLGSIQVSEISFARGAIIISTAIMANLLDPIIQSKKKGNYYY
jgi:hypothetical protein